MAAANQPSTRTTKHSHEPLAPHAPVARVPAKMGSGARGAQALKPRDTTTTRRRAILQAAAETFYRKGYDATTTQDIADAVGMLKGSLYYYISSKEELLYEVIHDVHEYWFNDIGNKCVCAMRGEPLTQIWGFVYNNVIGNADNLVNSAVFFREFEALTGEHRQAIVELRDRQDNLLRDLIKQGQLVGQVRDDVDPKVAATGILTMCSGLHRWYRPDGPLPAYKLARHFADLAVCGITTDLQMVETVREMALASRWSTTGYDLIPESSDHHPD